ncbi:acyl-CoA dehydrogenase family protein [Mycobacterium sp. CVI_P3]|uniref:Acyl-CoA dehydrogenase family protein n=1 Tax=Mycobacterium pinniadriaticum TaxID=2994102 RepID=A0ABT3SNY5_9MYCO|nr:acyl-CoA dehydrogenase family protein [Mycobacterium pinniadriaticum]MCX2934746.1 acyl-CoA dehydrogenase family protein [Mycobacterium pinniadriaticum]MCX2941168.1 acyl-CoA dehydrogenase family protein [Mycobacterium pinniadriaticum]
MDEAEFEQALLVVRAFVRDRVVPAEARIEQDDEIPDEFRTISRSMGLFGSAIPVVYGGLGLSMECEVRLAFELGYTTPALRAMFGTNNGIAGQVLLEAGSADQKSDWLPRIASGEVIASFALTEETAGSDPSTLRTSARREGGDWVIDGSKRFITNSPVADVFVVFARTDPDAAAVQGISAFLVERSTPGLSVGPRDKKMGQAGELTADVHFDSVRVPATSMIGGEGEGYSAALRSLGPGRARIAGLCVGMAQRLVDESLDYANHRHQSGRPIGSFQLVQGMLADSQTDLYAGRALALEAARAMDDGSDTRIGPSCAKYFCSEMVGRVADRAVQIHGGSGYIKGVPVERIYRDARLFRLYEGTSQIQQVIIATQSLRLRSSLT